jgi:hypothetical protein
MPQRQSEGQKKRRGYADDCNAAKRFPAIRCLNATPKFLQERELDARRSFRRMNLLLQPDQVKVEPFRLGKKLRATMARFRVGHGQLARRRSLCPGAIEIVENFVELSAIHLPDLFPHSPTAARRSGRVSRSFSTSRARAR